jgi:hypothetical protein
LPLQGPPGEDAREVLAAVHVGVEVVAGEVPSAARSAASAIDAPDLSASSVAVARSGVPPMEASATRPP